MAKKSQEEQIEEFRKWREVAPALNWRAWGSWHGWGSPVGLGLFFVLVSFAAWIWFQV